MALSAKFNGIVETGPGWIKDIYGDQFWIVPATSDREVAAGIVYDRDGADPVVLHRDGAPAVIRADGDMEWWVNGQLHREGAPAVIYADGTTKWYHHHKCHREDGPAIERADGSKEWLIDDMPHREDGPCTIDRNGQPFGWMVDGKRMSQREHDEYRASKIPASMGLSQPRILSAPKLKFSAAR